MSFLDSLTFPLRLAASAMATALLNGIGIPAARSGTGIYSFAGAGFNLEVADPCSGLRSLLSLAAIAAVYAYLFQRGLWRQWALFLFSVPLAVAGNVVRIAAVAVVARFFGQERAAGFYHDYSGYVFFAVAVCLMMAVSALLTLNLREALNRWKRGATQPT